MPRQARNVSSNTTRTVAQTRAAASRSASTSISGPTTRASSKRAGLTAGLQLALQQAQAPAGLPAVRQLRSRLVPLPPQSPCSPTDAVHLICVQGKRRRSHSVASSRASESTCTGAELVRGSSATRATRSTSKLRGSTPRCRGLSCVSRRPTRTANPRSLSQSPCLPRTRTNKAPLRKPEKAPADESLVVCPICAEQVSAGDVEAHVSDCTRTSNPCPLAWDNNCQWKGSVSHSVDHVVKVHRSVHCVTGPNAAIVLKSWRKAAPIHWSNLQTCLGHNFLVEIKKVERFDKYPNFYGVVRLFGQQEDADRFEYRMVMKTRGKMARVFSYSTTVRALHDVNSVISKDDAFVFDSSQAEIFSYEGNLEVEVSISVMKM